MSKEEKELTAEQKKEQAHSRLTRLVEVGAAIKRSVGLLQPNGSMMVNVVHNNVMNDLLVALDEAAEEIKNQEKDQKELAALKEEKAQLLVSSAALTSRVAELEGKLQSVQAAATVG
jgi:hypothetical protein